MKQVYSQNRSPHIYTKSSPAKVAYQSTKQNSESATYLGMEEQMKAYNFSFANISLVFFLNVSI